MDGRLGKKKLSNSLSLGPNLESTLYIKRIGFYENDEFNFQKILHDTNLVDPIISLFSIFL